MSLTSSRSSFLVLTFAAQLSAAAAGVDYLRDIKPVLAKRCYDCHGALKQKAGLRLDTAASVRKGAKGGEVIDLSAPEKSELLARITTSDEDERMPPEG